jgi:NTP pyrophosphatase (non-canonical NTP hydrolase)
MSKRNENELQELFDNIRDWATKRGLYDKGDVKTQYVKLGEEFGELGKSIIKDNPEELIDAIGDMVVVLTNLAHLAGTSIECCSFAAWGEIKDRKGAMKNGSFVKE